jgi:hypothetical protein
MAFLDNSGDIILDTVLTDAGRKALARGDGSFKIVKFALGDGEINYGLYDKTNSNGSAYYDLTILETPIEVAHTDATISLQHKLFSMATPTGDPGLLYLPEMKLNTTSFAQSALVSSRNAYVVVSEDDAWNEITDSGASAITWPNGYVDGRSAADAVRSLGFRVAQGMSTSAAGGNNDVLEALMTETQFSVVMDRRYLELVSPGSAQARTTTGARPYGTATAAEGATVLSPTLRSNVFSAANNLRVYTISTATDPSMMAGRPVNPAFDGPSAQLDLMLYVKASSLLQRNENYYFDNFGTEVASFDSAYGTMQVIETTIQVIGNTMGASVNIPVEVIAQIS